MAGYSPASITGNTLPSLAATYYDAVAIDSLFANLPFIKGTSPRQIPLHKGRTVQMFEYTPLSANTTQSTEGAVDTPEAIAETSVTATLGQYSDYVSVSDFAFDTAIDPVAENLSKQIGYQAALTLNSLVQAEFDAAITADATCNYVVPAGTNLSSATVRGRVADLSARNAHGLEGGQFVGIIHPFCVSDLLNDTANNGFVDIVKRNPELAKDLLLAGNDDTTNFQPLGAFGGVSWYSTSTAPSVVGVPASGDTAYNTYVAAKEGVMAISLGATELPGDKNFKLLTAVFRGPSVADPTRKIAFTCGYNYKFTTAIRPGAVQVIERIQAESATS